MAYGAVKAQAQQFVREGLGSGAPAAAQKIYDDGGCVSQSAIATAAAALPGPAGLTDDQVKFLVLAMIGGKSYADSVTALNATLQANQQPSAAVYAAWTAVVTARAAATQFYPG